MDERKSSQQAIFTLSTLAEWLFWRTSKMLLSNYLRIKNVLGRPHPQSSCESQPVLCIFCGSKASVYIERHHVSFLLCQFCAITARVWMVPCKKGDRFDTSLRCRRQVIELGSMRYLEVLGLMVELQFGRTVTGCKGRQKWVLEMLLPNGAKKF